MSGPVRIPSMLSIIALRASAMRRLPGRKVPASCRRASRAVATAICTAAGTVRSGGRP
jgi:hypothetical protein